MYIVKFFFLVISDISNLLQMHFEVMVGKVVHYKFFKSVDIPQMINIRYVWADRLVKKMW